MSRFRTCELCGASLDPGEKCTCDKDKSLFEKTISPQRAEKIAKEIQKDDAVAVFLFGGKVRRRKR